MKAKEKAATYVSRSLLGTIGPRRTLSDQIAERLRELVLSGELPAATPLSDSHVARELGVGRGSTREAFRQLLAEGFLERTTKGVRIAKLTSDDVRDIFDLRLAIECRAVRILAERHKITDLEVLQAIVARFQDAVEADDVQSAVLCDLRFHQAVCRLSGSTRIQSVFTREVEKMLALVRVDVDFYQPLSDWSAELPNMLEALERGDGIAAESAMEIHIERARSIVLLSGVTATKEEP